MYNVIRAIKNQGLGGNAVPAFIAKGNSLYQYVEKQRCQEADAYSHVCALDKTDAWMTAYGDADEINRIFMSYTA